MSEIATGWFEDVPMEEYREIPAMNASGLVEIRRSPAHFRHAADNPKPQTQEMAEGTALHYALLEPHLFAGRYTSVGQCEAIKKGDGLRCTSQGSVIRGGKSYCGTKGHAPEATAADGGIEIMPAEALTRIEAMKAAVMAHPEASSFFRAGGRSELTGVWIDEATGVPCKIRLDRDPDSRMRIHADLKRVADASERGFLMAYKRMQYALRSAFYRRGMKALGKEAIGSVLIAVEATAPHAVQTFLLDEDDIRAFQPTITGLLNQYNECLQTGRWDAYPAGFRHLKLPKWDVPEVTADDFNDNEQDIAA